MQHSHPSNLLESASFARTLGRPRRPPLQGIRMTGEARERLAPENRLRLSREITLVKSAGTPLRGRNCLVLVAARPAECSKVGFIASRRGVGGAVQRNRARRRLREIVRRRWPRVAARGYWMLFIASRGTLTAGHQELATEIEHLLAAAGALAPIGTRGD